MEATAFVKITVQGESDTQELCTWADFVAANSDDPEMCEEAAEELDRRGFYVGGGGAAPVFSLRTIDPHNAGPVQVSWITEYGLTQKLSQPITVF